MIPEETAEKLERRFEEIERRARLHGTFYALLPIVLTIGLFWFGATRYKQLIQNERQLESVRAEIDEKNAKLQGLKQQIADMEEMKHRLDAALQKSKDVSLKRAIADIELLPLKGYKVGIYYLDGDKVGEERAKALQSKLQSAKCPAIVQLYPKPSRSFDYYGRPTKDDLRFEPDYETAQAQALSSLLRKVDPEHSYALVPVQSPRTPNFLPILLRDGLAQ